MSKLKVGDKVKITTPCRCAVCDEIRKKGGVIINFLSDGRIEVESMNNRFKAPFRPKSVQLIEHNYTQTINQNYNI